MLVDLFTLNKVTRSELTKFLVVSCLKIVLFESAMAGEPTLGNETTNRTTTRQVGRLKWSNEMNRDLMECRTKA